MKGSVAVIDRRSTRGDVMVLGGLIAVLVSIASPARAQQPDAAAMAQEAFDRGRAQLRAGQLTAACSSFEESQRLAPGLGALLFLSDCREQIGKTATAWAGFREAAELAKRRGDEERRAVAEERAEKLAMRLSRIRFVTPANGVPHDLRITVDGLDVRSALFSTWLPVDPGERVVAVRAPGYRSAERRLQVPTGPIELEVSIPALVPEETVEPSPAPRANARRPPYGAEGTPVDKPSPPIEAGTEPHPATTPLYIAGGLTGATGLVGIAVGIYSGLRASSLYDDALTGCRARLPSPSGCSPAAIALRGDAEAAATGATVAFSLGGATAATGIVLLAVGGTLHGDGRRVAWRLSSEGAGVVLLGAF
jgi:serine/threonine-protein kinase